MGLLILIEMNYMLQYILKTRQRQGDGSIVST